MLQRLLFLALFLTLPFVLDGQQQSSWNSSWNGSVLPSTCHASQFFFLTTSNSLYICNTPNTWQVAGIPPGVVVLADGACPSGFTEATTWNGNAIVVTTIAAANVGTTGALLTSPSPGPAVGNQQSFVRLLACRKT